MTTNEGTINPTITDDYNASGYYTIDYLQSQMPIKSASFPVQPTGNIPQSLADFEDIAFLY